MSYGEGAIPETPEEIAEYEAMYKRGINKMDNKQKLLEDMNNTMLAAFKAIPNKDIGYIFYLFDKSEGGGGMGFNSNNCDAGDAMIAIRRIADQFAIFELLAEAANE